MKLLVISLDALDSNDLTILSKLPNFKNLLKKGTLVKDVQTMFVSNTYPIHTSMISGKYPKNHQLYDNCFFEKDTNNPQWRWEFDNIKSETVVSQALKKQLKIANIFWPVMCKAPLKYNLPEIIARDHQSQVMEILKNGSGFFIIKEFIRHFKQFKGINQPTLDDFSTEIACDILKESKCDLVLLHLTDTDTHKHDHGHDNKKVIESIGRMDKRLGKLTSCANDQYQILIVSDHSQISVDTNIDLNDHFANHPLKEKFWFYQTGGCALVLEKEEFTSSERKNLINDLKKDKYIKRLLNEEEMDLSGFNTTSTIGLVPNNKIAFSADGHQHHGIHGLPLDEFPYKPFYFVIGQNVKENQELKGGKIFDVCPLICQLLDIPTWDMDAKINNNIFIK
ncbi:MAG: ectonucleotide pyrophosphatase/phosphodiesterase [Erysipelotrichaceae bacterium]